MSGSRLPLGVYSYEDVLARIDRGELEFQKVRTRAGSEVSLIGLSPVQFNEILEFARNSGIEYLALFGSRVAGPRTYQRRLHPVLENGINMKVDSRHASVTFPAISDTPIPKDAIKELGFDDPLTSDLSVAVCRPVQGKDSEQRASHFEVELNRRLDVGFPIRVYLELHGHSFQTESDFLSFMRDGYIKKDLPKDHGFSDEEIEEAASLLFCTIKIPGI